jgi:alpha-L-fucosidase 2
VVNPWGNRRIRVRRASDNAILTTVSADEVTSATAANTVYVVERTAKPLTGSANQGRNSVSGTASTLGSGSGTGGTAPRAQADNQYVTAENAGAAALIANRDAVGPWEKFTLVPG